MIKIMTAAKQYRSIGTLTLLILLAVGLAACGGGRRPAAGPSGGPAVSSTPAPTGSASTPGSSSAPATGSEGGGTVVTLANFSFGPDEIRIKAGTTVTFVNEDQIAHDVVQASPATVNSGTPGFASPQIMPGSSWSHTFNEPGTYPILCTVGAHYIVGMTAEVIVE